MAGFTHTKLLYEIPEAMELMSSCRSVIFEEIRSGRLCSVKRGRSRLIPASAVDDRRVRGAARTGIRHALRLISDRILSNPWKAP